MEVQRKRERERERERENNIKLCVDEHCLF